MASDISTAGMFAIYGIYFDTRSAVLKAESDRSLKEIAALLTRDPT